MAELNRSYLLWLTLALESDDIVADYANWISHSFESVYGAILDGVDPETALGRLHDERFRKFGKQYDATQQP